MALDIQQVLLTKMFSAGMLSFVPELEEGGFVIATPWLINPVKAF